MGDVVIVEAAEHMQDGVTLTDVGEEFVAEAFALGRAFHKAGDIYYFNCGRYNRFRVAHLDESSQTVIGNGDDTHVGFDGAERKVGRLGLSVRKTVEKS